MRKAEMDKAPLCKCGCGQPVKKNKDGKWNTMLNGHARKKNFYNMPEVECGCGCGELAGRNRYGKPLLYIRGHSKRRTPNLDMPLQLCACGCGEYAGRNKDNKPNRFISFHQNKLIRPKKHSAETREKLRKSRIAYIEQAKLNGEPLMPVVGKDETRILNEVEAVLHCTLERQFPVAGYYIDGYSEELKLAVEVDESHHKYQQEEDAERQAIIEERLGCQFMRIAV